MDLSPVNSGIRSSSDFSIERILSESPTLRQEVDHPSWLQCTRYQPPRLPRIAVTSACRSRRSGRHARVPFTAGQAAALENAYARAPYLAPPALRALAQALQLRDDRIKIWFQNRRARERREKCATIPPPHAITLPATSLPHMPCPPRSEQWTSNTVDSYVIVNGARKSSRCFSEPPRDTQEACYINESVIVSNENLEDRPESPLDIETVED